MKRLTLTIFFLFGICIHASADVWRWVDASGDTHFVDTDRPIYTWLDEVGKRHYADKPGHSDAVSVELVWHSTGTLENIEQDDAPTGESGGGFAFPGETEAERAERESAEAYYCKHATEIYNSYLNAPALYKTNASGEKEYLSEEEEEQTLSATKAKVDDLCN